MSSLYSKIERQKQFLTFLMDKYEPKCFFCGEKMDSLSFYRNKSGKQLDDFTVHHVDENRSNNHISNLVLAHRKCHLKHHRQKEKAQWEAKYASLRGAELQTIG
jgi:hypothetical protein